MYKYFLRQCYYDIFHLKLQRYGLYMTNWTKYNILHKSSINCALGSLNGCYANAPTTVFQRRDNGEKWRIHKLQQRSVLNVLIYYDAETYFFKGKYYAQLIDDLCKMLYFVQLVIYNPYLCNFKWKIS
jgi:hypothetical protein